MIVTVERIQVIYVDVPNAPEGLQSVLVRDEAVRLVKLGEGTVITEIIEAV